MSFDVPAQAYTAFMGRFSEPLAPMLADLADVTTGSTAAALDVGCGPGALTQVLVARLGAGRVAAVDPSSPFVDATRQRLPGVDVRLGRAEALPFGDAAFDVVLAQLVVHFLAEPVRGIAEMARVARPGGVVAAAVWDHGGAHGPLAAFWAAALELSPEAPDESGLPGVHEGQLRDLFTQAGLVGCTSSALTVEVHHASFEAWWEPFTLGVGPAGAYLASLDAAGRERLRERCQARLPTGAFTTRAVAWAETGRAR